MAMEYINGGSLGSAVAGDKMTFAEPIGDASRQLTDVVMRLNAVAVRLCGSIPLPPQEVRNGNIPTAVPNGIFEEIGQRGRDMCADLENARLALNRIERALP